MPAETTVAVSLAGDGTNFTRYWHLTTYAVSIAQPNNMRVTTICID